MTKKILFLLGSAHISGGTYVILQHAEYMQKLGYKVIIALVFMKIEEYLVLKHSPDCWHPAIKELEFIHIDDAEHYPVDVAVFTWWATLFSFEKISASSYVYFVQSIESRFYEKDETFMQNLVNNTYKIGLPSITEASWIQKVLQSQYQNQCELVRNGILKSLYTAEGEAFAEKSKDHLRILIEGPLKIAYKNVERTIELCRQANVGEIWLLTSSKGEGSIRGVTRIFSQVPITDVPKIYRSCDVLVKLSYVEGMFGSPLEMFHCGGTAIVYDVTGSDEYIVHHVNALVAKPDDEERVIHYLRRLHEDRNLLTMLIEGAKETARQWINWIQSSNGFAQAIERLAGKKTDIHNNINKYLKERLGVVIIKNNHPVEKEFEASPTYNSGHYILSIPLTDGRSQIAIGFGQCYKRVRIKGINLTDVSSHGAKVQYNASCVQMIQQSDKLFEAQTKEGRLVIAIDLTPSGANVETICNLQIEFNPVAVWDSEEDLREFKDA